MEVTALILAAGEGTRMKSAHAKVVHKVLGKPLVKWVVDAARAGGADRVVVVVGSHAQEVRDVFGPDDRVEFVEQTERLGTGHAVKVALEGAKVPDGVAVVLYGDAPLIEADTLRSIVAPVKAGQVKGALATWRPEDPFGYGRVEVDERGHAVRIVEQKDCTPEQSRDLRECNPGVYAFDVAELRARIGELTTDNAQHEYYLTDLVELFRAAGNPLTAVHQDDEEQFLGVNSRAQLARITCAARDRINARLMGEGVSMIDPSQVWIGPDCTVGRDTVIWPQTHLIGSTHVGEECVLGPNSRLTDTRVGSASVLDETVAIEAVIENGVNCGPRAYLRPGTHLLDGSKAGTHVEIKKSTIGEGSKVPHLSYIGDTVMGPGVNVGAGSITCNYDGVHKNPTHIGARTFIGSNTMMVAPVSIGDDVVTGAGSVITHDVPSGALAIERSPQHNVAGYTAKKRAEKKE